MRKSKRREQLRDAIKRSRGGARLGAGHPLAPTRTERDYLEAARAGARRLAPVAVATLGRAMKEEVPSHAVAAACALLDRAGIPKTLAVETVDPVRELMLAIAAAAADGSPDANQTSAD